jgi:hypothetical protein
MLLNRVATILFAFSIVPVTSTVLDEPAPVTLVEVRHAAIDFNFSGGRVPEWSGGALVVTNGNSGLFPTVCTFGRDGRILSRLVFKIPQSGSIRIYGFARAPDGTLALAGSAQGDDSGGFTYLSVLSSDGQRQQTVRLKPFAPFAAAIASDGAIWAAGWERTADGREVADYNVVRRYSPSGKDLGAYIPRSSLKSYRYGPPAMSSFLVSSHGRVGWYSNVAREYIEFSLDGQVVTRVAGATHGEHDEVTGAGLCGGNLYVSVFTSPSDHKERKWEVLTLDRISGTWKTVSLKGDPPLSSYGRVYGCDGTDLVIHNRLPGELKGLSWFRRSSPE